MQQRQTAAWWGGVGARANRRPAPACMPEVCSASSRLYSSVCLRLANWSNSSSTKITALSQLQCACEGVHSSSVHSVGHSTIVPA